MEVDDNISDFIEKKSEWKLSDLPWNEKEISIKEEMKNDRLKNKVKLRKLDIGDKIFKSRNIKKNVDPFEKDQMFINECMKMKDKKDVDEYKKIFNEIWKDETNYEKVRFYYDIISQYDFKIKKISIPNVFNFDDIKCNIYCKTIGKTYFISTDELYWIFIFWIFYWDWLGNISETYKEAKAFNDFWLGEKKDDKYTGAGDCLRGLDSVKIVSNAFSLKYGYATGYFQDYSSDYYYGDLMRLGVDKKNQLKVILEGSESESFYYNHNKYLAYKLNFEALGLDKYKDWTNPVFICKENQNDLTRGFQLLQSMTGVYVEHVKDDVNIMKAGLKTININKEKNYYFIDLSFKPTYFCPSCISFPNSVEFEVLFETSIDYDKFLNECVGRGFLCFPFASLKFNNLDSVFRLSMLFLFFVSVQKVFEPDKEYLESIREMMRVYLRNKDVFRMASMVYDKFKFIVLGYIDGLFGKFYYSKFVKIYKISSSLINEYKKVINYFYVDSEVTKFINFWGLSGVLMQNFIKPKTLDVIVGVNNACYQIVNYVSKDVALYLRTAGSLCYTVLFNGAHACLTDIRPHCMFLGGLEGNEDAEDVFNRIAILVDTKKHREDISRQSELLDIEKVGGLSKIVLKRYKNAIEEIIKEKKLNEKFKDFIWYVAMFLKDIEDINNIVMEETNELMKEKKIAELEKNYGVVSNLELNNIIKDIIINVFAKLKPEDDPASLLDEDSELSKNVYDAIYDDLRVLNAGNEADMASSGSIKRSLIEKLKKKINEMNINELQKINKNKRIKYNFKKKKKKNLEPAPSSLLEDYMKRVNN